MGVLAPLLDFYYCFFLFHFFLFQRMCNGGSEPGGPWQEFRGQQNFPRIKEDELLQRWAWPVQGCLVG